MSQLLISVRDVAEAKLALSNGADLIDLKEPDLGSLGPCDVDVWRQVTRYVAGRRPISAALGELLQGRSEAEAAADFDFVKIGLAGCASLGDWQRRWAAVLESLPDRVGRVAVGYVDHRQADSPAPSDVIAAARRLNCQAILLDTFGKQRGGLFHHLPPAAVRNLIQIARSSRMLTVLGGSLSFATLELALSLGPDFVALRGAVCGGDRQGQLDGTLVREFAQRIAGARRLQAAFAHGRAATGRSVDRRSVETRS